MTISIAARIQSESYYIAGMEKLKAEALARGDHTLADRAQDNINAARDEIKRLEALEKRG